jgi:hypothetical protein
MTERFVIDGREVEDTVLFYWSIVSISRALRFNSEAQRQKAASHVLATVAGYYSLFHLGMFLLNSAPHIMSAALRERISNVLRKGIKDPSRALHHDELITFIRDCRKAGLPPIILSLFEKAKELREFVNYGPDLLTTPEGFRVFNRAHHPHEADDILSRIETAFVEGVEWASQTEADSRLLVPIALSKAADFFLPNADGAPYYSEWSSQDVLGGAEDLRKLLEHRSQRLVYPKG